MHLLSLGSTEMLFLEHISLSFPMLNGITNELVKIGPGTQVFKLPLAARSVI